jgi:hypothetical protein
MRQREGLNVFAASLAALVLLAVPASGQFILPGIDAFETAGSGTATTVNLPAGFFCSGSPAINTAIALQGVPLTTNPPGILGTADTVVERLAAADLSNGCDTVPVVVRALSLTSSTVLNVSCGGNVTKWRVNACSCSCGTEGQPITEIKICPSSDCPGCGKFEGKLEINVCLTFTEVSTGATRGPIQAPVALAINGMEWCEQGLAGEVEIKDPFKVDTNCDNRADLAIPGTSNFHPGVGCGSQGKDCWQEHANLTHCHPNYNDPNSPHEHCVNPICGKRQ